MIDGASGPAPKPVRAAALRGLALETAVLIGAWSLYLWWRVPRVERGWQDIPVESQPALESALREAGYIEIWWLPAFLAGVLLCLAVMVVRLAVVLRARRWRAFGAVIVFLATTSVLIWGNLLWLLFDINRVVQSVVGYDFIALQPISMDPLAELLSWYAVLAPPLALLGALVLGIRGLIRSSAAASRQ